MILEENVFVMNKAQSGKKFYAYNAVFRVDVNDVKTLQKITGRLPQLIITMIRNLCQEFSKQKRRLSIQIWLFLPGFNSLLRGLDKLRAYQHDYVIGNYLNLL